MAFWPLMPWVFWPLVPRWATLALLFLSNRPVADFSPASAKMTFYYYCKQPATIFFCHRGIQVIHICSQLVLRTKHLATIAVLFPTHFFNELSTQKFFTSSDWCSRLIMAHMYRYGWSFFSTQIVKWASQTKSHRRSVHISSRAFTHLQKISFAIFIELT